MNITDIYSKLETTTISNETLVACNDFYNLLKKDNDIRYIDCIITPYYISGNKRYELYEYELVMSSTETFRHYMTIASGRDFESINNNVVKTREHCYIELMNKGDSDITAEMIRYLEYLKNNINLKKEIEAVFGEFVFSKMFIAIYY